MAEKFEYKYEAPSFKEREEINNIRRQYLPENKEMSKMDRLRYLDNKVKSIPLIWSLSFGICGTLIFGVSMTFFLEWVTYWYVGIPFGIIGIVLIIIAYPIYKSVLNKFKIKYGKEIIDLSNELLNENEEQELK